MLYLYLQFAKNYGWTPDQCDEQDMDTVFEMLLVAYLTKDEADQQEEDKVVYIDQVPGF